MYKVNIVLSDASTCSSSLHFLHVAGGVGHKHTISVVSGFSKCRLI